MKNAVVDMLPNICNIWWEEKLTFCNDILEADENGFHLTIRDPEHLNCNNVSFLVYFLTRSTLESSTLSIFFCPQICFEDLETNERVCLPNYTYAVSQALEHTSASTFVRRDLQSAWYTKYHVTDIDFKRIESRGVKSKTSNLVPEVNDDDLIKLYLQAKRIPSRK